MKKFSSFYHFLTWHLIWNFFSNIRQLWIHYNFQQICSSRITLYTMRKTQMTNTNSNIKKEEIRRQCRYPIPIRVTCRYVKSFGNYFTLCCIRQSADSLKRQTNERNCVVNIRQRRWCNKNKVNKDYSKFHIRCNTRSRIFFIVRLLANYQCVMCVCYIWWIQMNASELVNCELTSTINTFHLS